MKKKQSGITPRPLWFRILNKAWDATYPSGTKISLKKDDLIKRSRKATGLHDFGQGYWEEPLDRMLGSLEEEADLNPIGRFIIRERLVNLLNIRLRAGEYFRKFPEILDQPLYPAWIIVGLQRTGTTKLQRLLAADPDHRTIPSWEALNPVPIDAPPPLRAIAEQLGRVPGGRADKRIRIARTSARALKLISPDFYTIHPIEIFEPEEDVLLLDVSFLSTTTEAMVRVPSYTLWLESIDQTPAYEYYVKLLKLLQWFRPAKRWVLKSPHHLEFTDIIVKQMGNVRFIWPHRPVTESIASFLSMLTYNHMIFSNRVDIHDIAERWIRKTGYVLNRAIDFRTKDNNDRFFIDVDYKDLVTDSIRELSGIYSLNGGLSAELIAKFHRHEKEHPHRKYGAHLYSLDDFGLSEEKILHHTKSYQQFLHAQSERNPAEEI